MRTGKKLHPIALALRRHELREDLQTCRSLAVSRRLASPADQVAGLEADGTVDLCEFELELPQAQAPKVLCFAKSGPAPPLLDLNDEDPRNFRGTQCATGSANML